MLLLEDMVDLRTMKKHEVFLSLKRDLAMVRISNYIYIYIYIYIFYLYSLPSFPYRLFKPLSELRG